MSPAEGTSVDIIIATALGLESAVVVGLLADVHVQEGASGFSYPVGVLEIDVGSTAVVAVAEVGVGHVAAAAGTERALNDLAPSYAAFVGVAAGVKDVAIGDVVIATKVSVVDYGKYTQEGFIARAEQFRPDPSLVARARALRAAGLLEAQDDETYEVHVGPVAAVNAVVAALGPITIAIHESFGDTVALAMEDGGFLAATSGHTSVRALVARGVSDFMVDKSSTDDKERQPRAVAAAASVALRILGHALAEAMAVRGDAGPRATPSSIEGVLPPRPIALAGRHEVALTLRERAQEEGSATAIIGPGGIGKSALAAEVAHLVRNAAGEVVWARGSSAAEFLLSLTEAFGPAPDAVEHARVILAARPVLLLIDDADPNVVAPLLSACRRAPLLLTSRMHAWPPAVRRISLEALDDEDSFRLLAAVSGRQDEETALRALLPLLRGLPLGLVQAGAYLASSTVSVLTYADALSTDLVGTLNRSADQLNGGLTATVHAAMGSLREMSEDAVTIACLISFMDAAPVAVDAVVELARGGLVPLTFDASERSELDLHDMVALLGAVGVAQVEGRVLRMHSLTAGVLRDAMGHAADDLRRAAAFVAMTMSTDYDPLSASMTPVDVLGHLRTVADGLPETGSQNLWLRALVLSRLASFLRARGSMQGALAAIDDARAVAGVWLATDENAARARHEAGLSDWQATDLLTDLDLIEGTARATLGDPAALAILQNHVQRMVETGDNAAVAVAHSVLGRAAYLLQDTTRAIAEATLALDIDVQRAAPADVLVLRRVNLARMHLYAGDKEQATIHANAALSLYEESGQGSSHVSEAHSILVEAGGTPEEVETVLRAALSRGRFDLRARAVNTANLAMLRRDAGAAQEAVDLLTESVGDAALVWGPDHEETSHRHRQLAAVLHDVGKLEAAYESLARARATALTPRLRSLTAILEARFAIAREDFEAARASLTAGPDAPLGAEADIDDESRNSAEELLETVMAAQRQTDL